MRSEYRYILPVLFSTGAIYYMLASTVTSIPLAIALMLLPGPIAMGASKHFQGEWYDERDGLVPTFIASCFISNFIGGSVSFLIYAIIG